MDPDTGTSTVVSSRLAAEIMAGPVLTVVPKETEQPAYHVKGAPIGSLARGNTYDSSEAAFRALGRMVDAGQVTTGDVAVGLIVVRPGAWPVASYPPPAPPVVDEPAPFVAVVDRLVSTVDPVVPAPLPRPGEPGSPWVKAPVTDGAPSGFTWETRAETVSSVAVARITEDERYLADLGLAMPPPVRTFGGTVNSIGRANVQASRNAWEHEPRTLDTMGSVADAIRSEARRDQTVELGILYMQDDGKLGTFDRNVSPNAPLRDLAYTDIDGGLRLEETALRDLVALYPRTLIRAGAFLSACPAPVRAKAWNEARGNARDLDSVVLRKRTTEDGKRSAFAVVSPGYTACDADVVAQWTAAALERVPGGTTARGGAVYDPATTRLTTDAIWHADNVVDFAAGDVFKMGVRVTSADDGSGAIRVNLVAWRNLCFNLLITSQTAANMARIVHRGDQWTMIQRLQAGIEHAARGAAPFLARWGHLRNLPIEAAIENPSTSVHLNLRALISGLAGASDEDLPTVRPSFLPANLESTGDPKAFIDACLASYRHEPNGTLADVINAITGLHRERVLIPVLAAAQSNAGILVDAWGARA